jgi:CubicO group peptidase (beta-lactamase class C family)
LRVTPEPLLRDLSSRVRSFQRGNRVPGVAVALARRGEILWEESIGLADVEAGREATPDTQYRVGSITKTFTAVAVLQLRDAGILSLDDRLGDHVEEAAHPGPTIRRLLAHTSGLQREPVGEVWETMESPTVEELLARLHEAEQVLEPGRFWHYSNLAFALLGVVVARRAGRPYRDAVQERILDPLGLARTTWEPAAPRARGYLVDSYSDGVRPELDDADLRGDDAAGQLWSTPRDLCRWAAFLCDPDPAVLARETVDEMHSVQVMVDAGWTSAWGLGVELVRVGERILAGHGGGMPGHVTGFAYARQEGLAAAVLSNAEAPSDEEAQRLVVAALEAFPPEPGPWRPDAEPVPERVAGVLGRWWSEGQETIFSWRHGRLEARQAAERPGEEPSVFAEEAPDRFRVASGSERGEVLRVVRDEAGTVVKLYWATYPFRREPFTFGEP